MACVKEEETKLRRSRFRRSLCGIIRRSFLLNDLWWTPVVYRSEAQRKKRQTHVPLLPAHRRAIKSRSDGALTNGHCCGGRGGDAAALRRFGKPRGTRDPATVAHKKARRFAKRHPASPSSSRAEAKSSAPVISSRRARSPSRWLVHCPWHSETRAYAAWIGG